MPKSKGMQIVGHSIFRDPGGYVISVLLKKHGQKNDQIGRRGSVRKDH